MTRRSLYALAAGLALFVGAPATASAQAPPGPPTGALEVTQLDLEAHFALVDNPPRQGSRREPTRGDIYTVTGAVRNPAGVRVGHLSGSFVSTSGGRRGVAEATVTFTLGGGQIFIQGESGSTSTDVFAITGGTGAYANARGNMVATFRRNDARFVFNFAG